MARHQRTCCAKILEEYKNSLAALTSGFPHLSKTKGSHPKYGLPIDEVLQLHRTFQGIQALLYARDLNLGFPDNPALLHL